MSECAPFVNMRELRDLFPSYTKETMWRLNTKAGGPSRLPPADRRVGGQDHWWIDTILEWAEATGRRGRLDEEALARICQSQAVD